ncbi:biotin transporter BioY [Enterovirga sp. CN4-39]|uniref:biotin transporter BioY n=1 Tax=Enterovirga sp. CN4-39 TaxID=3400910 RepID=UPI003C031BF5
MTVALTRIALFAALIAVLGIVPRLELAAGVPITAQSLAVMLAGSVLGARRGALAVLLFLTLVLLGLPLLAGGRGGLGVLAGPTVGYIIGFPIAAFVIGLIVERRGRIPIAVASFIGSVAGGLVILNLLGALGMAWRLSVPFAEALALTLAFVPGDLVKAALAAILTQALARARPQLWQRETRPA